ncbi:MAG TPA: hypothetical protein VFY26_03415 [Anaerolineales bacterium]|nr:hypothetical protein [Anaerolineales bacterium]
MKTNVTLAMILWVWVAACGTTIDVPAPQTLPQETALAGASETATAIAPTEPVPPVLLTLTARPTATDTPTPTPIPTPTPLPELPPNAADLQWISAYGLPGDQFATKIHLARDGGYILVGGGRLLKLRADGLIEWQTYLPQVNGFMGELEVLETSRGDILLAGAMHWMRFDTRGNLLWNHPVEGASYPTGRVLRLVEEGNGNIVVEGPVSQAVFNAQGELQSFSEREIPDSRMSPEELRDRLDDNRFDLVFFFQTTADGGALVGNYTYSNSGDVANIVTDIVFSGLSEDGSIRWQTGYGGYYLASFDDVFTFETRSGDILIAGTLTYYANQADRSDVWIVRLGRDGTRRWDKLYATEGLDAVTDIRELANGDLILAGHTRGAGIGGQDLWVLKTDTRGEIPNCGLVFDGTAGLFGSFPEVETEMPEVEPRLFGDDVQAIPVCLPTP